MQLGAAPLRLWPNSFRHCRPSSKCRSGARMIMCAHYSVRAESLPSRHLGPSSTTKSSSRLLLAGSHIVGVAGQLRRSTPVLGDAQCPKFVVFFKLFLQLRGCVLVYVELSVACHGCEVAAVFLFQLLHKLLQRRQRVVSVDAGMVAGEGALGKCERTLETWSPSNIQVRATAGLARSCMSPSSSALAKLLSSARSWRRASPDAAICSCPVPRANFDVRLPSITPSFVCTSLATAESLLISAEMPSLA